MFIYWMNQNSKDVDSYKIDTVWLNFSKINDRHKSTIPGGSHNTKQDKYKKLKATLIHLIFKLEKIKDKRKSQKKLNGRESRHLACRQTKDKNYIGFPFKIMQARRECYEIFNVLKKLPT